MSGWKDDAEQPLLTMPLDSTACSKSYEHKHLWGDSYAEQQLTQLIAFIFHVGRSANYQLCQTNSSVQGLHVDN